MFNRLWLDLAHQSGLFQTCLKLFFFFYKSHIVVAFKSVFICLRALFFVYIRPK